MASATSGAPPPECCATCTRSFSPSEAHITAHRDSALPSLAEAPWLKANSTRAVFAALRAAGHDARAVGGVVRNSLLGRPITDIDIATPASPEAVMEAIRAAGLSAIPTGLDHGTVTVLSESIPYEVTTLRRDVETDGRRAVVAFTGDWAEDARRRDFTMNALYCDETGHVHDPIGGYDDLVAGRVRFIGDARARIREDYLRILRFFRVYAVYGDAPLDADGLAACVRERAGLAQLSAERIRAELVKLLAAPRALEATRLMAAYGILVDVLGMAPRLGMLARAIEGEAALALSPDPMLRLSCLAMAVEDDRPRLARHLRLSTEERRALRVVDLQIADRLGSLDGAAARRHLYRSGLEAWTRDVAALAAVGAGYHEAARKLARLPTVWPVPVLPVRGADLIAAGIRSGPEIGDILAEIEAWWTDQDFPSEPAVRDRLEAVLSARKGR